MGPTRSPLLRAKPHYKVPSPWLSSAEPPASTLIQRLRSFGHHGRSMSDTIAKPLRTTRNKAHENHHEETLLMSPLMRVGGRRSPSPTTQRVRNPKPAPETDKSLTRTTARRSDTNVSTDLPTLTDLPEVGSDDENEAPDPPPSRTERAAKRRTMQRLETHNMADETTICKYLPLSLVTVLGPPIMGPDDCFAPPAWLLQAASHVANSPCPTPKAPPVRFSTLQHDLEANANLISKHNNDLKPLLASAKGTTMDPAAEFRPIAQLTQLFHQHPNFAFVHNMITNGMEYTVVRELSEQQRTRELEANLSRGNHKSASESLDHLTRLLARDVKYGFALPIPTSTVRNLKGAMVQPAGLANQFTLQPDGTRVQKQRLTHDLSYSATIPDAAVNARIDMSAYPDMIYGWCLLRVVHFIVALRHTNPSLPILIAKYDFSDAYRRIAHTPNAAAKTILALNDVAYIMLRLAFGGSPNPPAWCAFSEMVTDLANELPLCDEWNPDDLFSPAQPNPSPPTLLPNDKEYGQAAPMAVHIPTTVTAKADCFIDDIIQVMLGTTRNIERQTPAVLLAVHLSNRPHHGTAEPMPRRANISEPKLKAEGTPAEVQTVLGWELSTRELVVRLPQDKFIAWTVDVAEIIRTKRVQFGELESCIGRLNHVAFLIPLSRHFIPRLQRHLNPRRPKNQHITLNANEVEDLKLWLKFLHWGRQGVSMNLITHRYPSVICISDSCPFGLGGFLWTGRAWRLQIPTASIIHGNHIANNALEMLAMLITIWLAVIDDPTEHRCILSLGDNTSAIGWLFHSSFQNNNSVYEHIVPLMARQLATILLESRQVLFGQHLAGAINTVADLLSFTHQTRDGKHNPLAHDCPDDIELTHRFHAQMPQLIPQDFKICPLPTEILSFATLALQTMESSMRPRAKRPLSQKTAPGGGGLDSAKQQVFINPSSITYPTKPANSSSDHSSPASGPHIGPKQETFLASVRDAYRQRLSEMPQATWLRRFGSVSGQAPCTSRTAPSSYLPSKHSSKPSKT